MSSGESAAGNLEIQAVRAERESADLSASGVAKLKPNRPKPEKQRSGGLKQGLLYSLIASILLGAGLGIFVVLRDSWGWFETRVILTTITIAVASICGLTCDFAKTPRGSNLLPYTGLGLSFLTTVLILLGIWSDIDIVNYWKTTAIMGTFGAATVHICLLSVATLAAHFRWVYWITWQIVYGLAAVIAIAIVWEIDEQRIFQVIAVLSILVAASTLLIPVLHRLSRTAHANPDYRLPLEQRNLAAIEEEIQSLMNRLNQLKELKQELQIPDAQPEKDCSKTGPNDRLNDRLNDRPSDRP